MSDIHGKKLFFGGKRPAQRVMVRDVEEEDSQSMDWGGCVDALTPPVLKLFPWGVSDENGSVVELVHGDTGCEDSRVDDGCMSLPCGEDESVQAKVGDVPLVSPIPVDSWEEFENHVDMRGDDCLGDDGDVLRAWLNGVLDPWGTSAALGSHVAIYSHKDVLKDRIRRQWMDSSLKEEFLSGPMKKVSQKIGRDVIGLARRVEHVVQTPVLHSRVIKAFRSYSYVWLEVAHGILCGKGMAGGEAVSGNISAKEEEWLFRILSIPLNTNSVRKNHIQYYSTKLSPHGYARVVRHMLAIIVFLDGVFSSSWTIPLWAPPLFVGQSSSQETHSSHHVLQETLGLLLDQVDVCRYLQRYGCTVSYIQPRSHCAIFHVRNLAVDLRDGVTLCRLSEMLLGSSLHPVYPAVKTSDRIGNIHLALASMGLCAPGVAEHIADGNQAATMGVLWECIVKFELEKMLNVNAIQLECDHILASVGNGDVEPLFQNDCATWTRYPAVASILRWIQCLCVSYEVSADDFWGTARDRICVLEAFFAYYGDNNHSVHCARSSRTHTKPTLFDKIDYMLRGCGGIPRLLTMDEYANNTDIDHRHIVVFYALLCKRVLCMNYEHRAAIVIQRFWRRICHRKPGYARENLEKWIHAARVIQRNVRPFLCRRGVEKSASSRRLLYERIVSVQAIWRRIMAVKHFNAIKDSALAIQTEWRAYRARCLSAMMQKEYDASVVIQSFWRQHYCSTHFNRVKMASITVGKNWRSYECRKTFLVTREAAISIQRYARRMLVQRYMDARWEAAVVIQNHYRSQKARKEYSRAIDASKVIEKHWRRFHAQQEARDRLRAVITIQQHFRKFRELRIQRIHSMLEHQTERLSRAMKEFSIQILDEYRADRARRLALLEEERKTSAARMIQTGWRRFRLRRDVSTYLLNLYETSKRKVEMNEMYGSAAIVLQACYRKHVVCKNHPLSQEMAGIRQRLMEATERSRVLREEGVEDPTTLWNIMQRALIDFERGNALPSKGTLQDLTMCLGSSSTCCEAFLKEHGVDFTIKGIIRVSRDKYRYDSIIQACTCLESLSGCGRFVDQVGQILLDSGHVEALTMLMFQLRDDHEPFHALVSLVGVIANSRLFAGKVSSSKELSSKLLGVHRNLGVKHGQVASYLNKLEGRKGSDISAANATRMLFKMGNQISALEKLLDKLEISRHQDKQPEESAIQGKNTIVRQVLREISNNTVNL